MSWTFHNKLLMPASPLAEFGRVKASPPADAGAIQALESYLETGRRIAMQQLSVHALIITM
jgi:hypothetical protein